jgi:hypothetical protein
MQFTNSDGDTYFKTILMKISARIQRMLKIPNRRKVEFEPYVMDLDVEGIRGRFFIGTPQAEEWYDPIKPYAKLEYEWVIKNVLLRGQKIVDVGAHHGHYALVFNRIGAPRLRRSILIR